MTSIAVEICERLAALARVGYPVRHAVTQLPAWFDGSIDAIPAAARRARLGYPMSRCLEPLGPVFGDDFPYLLRCLGTTAEAGADWARELDRLAEAIRARAAREREASIAAAGATLSARTIAVLPFLMLPVAVKQLSDPAVAMSVVAGVALGYVGYRWLRRIVPSPPADDPTAALADEVAASVTAGMSLDRALRDAVSRRHELASSVRKVDLGASWADVLASSSPEIAGALVDASRTGTPVAASLRRRASEIRRRRAQSFQNRVQRAPIRMVIPLVCCILPSFILVAIVPLLRGLAHPA